MNAKFPMPEILLLSVSVLCVPLALYAQDEEMSDEQMQQMMENAEKMQDCTAQMDQEAMAALAAKGEKVIAEVKNLCSAGKRDEAQKIAIEYGKEVVSSKEMQVIQQCGGMAASVLITGQEEKPDHVCDSQ